MNTSKIQAARQSKDRVGDAHAICRDLIDNLTRTCVNCGKFESDDLNYICKQYNMKPPPRVIINGCEQHSDLIPF